MKKSKVLFYATVFSTGAYLFSSCSGTSKSEHSETEEHDHSEMNEGEHDHAEMEGNEDHYEHESGEEHHHEHENVETEGSKTWMPSGNGEEVIQSDFHFVVGQMSNITPETKEVDGTTVLEVTADGTPTAFVFHASYGNVGIVATLKKIDFKGKIKVVHHVKDKANYEFVSIEGNNMQLGRMVEGKPTILDKGAFSSTNDWMVLKSTAAGTHYKGYVGETNVTHGHAEEMEDGYVGLMLEGSGKIQIKSIEIAKLESE